MNDSAAIDSGASSSGANPSEASSQAKGTKDRHVMRWLVVGLLFAVGLVISWLLGSAVIPRWWAQRMSDLIDGSLVRGSFVGLGVGLVFTFVPLMILRLGLKFRRGPKSIAAFFVAAAVVAAPNLFTLGIVLGSGNAAHAGERILDVDGPGFRGGSLIGAIVGLLVGGWMLWLMRSRRRNKERARALESELRDKE